MPFESPLSAKLLPLGMLIDVHYLFSCQSAVVSEDFVVQVCYLQHAFSAGEHYHSVVALDSKADQEW